MPKYGWQVIDCTSHTVSLEYEDGRWWIHHTVKGKWTRDKQKRIQRDLRMILGAIKAPIWALSPDHVRGPTNTKFHRYVLSMGFEEMLPEYDGCGELCRTYRCVNGKE